MLVAAVSSEEAISYVRVIKEKERIGKRKKKEEVNKKGVKKEILNNHHSSIQCRLGTCFLLKY